MVTIQDVRTVYGAASGATTRLRIVEPEEVPPDVAHVACSTVGNVGDALGLPDPLPEIFFVTLAEPDDPDAFDVRCGAHALGFTWPTAKTPHIFVRTGMSLEQTARVCAHEVRHTWQGWRGFAAAWTPDQLELDAHRFDRLWMKR